MILKARGTLPCIPLLFVLLLPFICTQVLAQTLYSVILNSPKTDAGVVIDNQVYVLTSSMDSDIVLEAMAPSGRRYYYAKLRKGTTEIIDREPFMRNPVRNEWTYNEFYGRNWNAKTVESFNTVPVLEKNFNRINDFKIHPPGEITTVHIVAPQADINNIHENFLDSININVSFTHISANSINTFVNCKFGISGRTSRYFNKLPYKIKIPKESGNLGGYRSLKLRAIDNDPSYMREYLATDIIRAMNQPATRGSYVRVFINDRAIGLFFLLEKYDSTWLGNQFNQNDDQVYKNGPLYEGNGGTSKEDRADLSFKGNNLDIYKKGPYDVAVESLQGGDQFQPLIDFTAFLRDQNEMSYTRNLAAITLAETSWDKLLDVDGLLANMAIEFFLGFSDGYTQNTNNYFLYFDPHYERYVFIPWDFDYTFGSGPFDMEAILVGDYEQYGRLSDLPLTAAIIGIPKYRERFENILDIMAVSIMDPAVSFPIVDSVAELIREDVEWDLSLPRVRSGPSWLNGAIEGYIKGKADKHSIFPYCTSIGGAIDFLRRVNSKINFDFAINGRPKRESLVGIKEFFERKVANYYRKSNYKPGILETALQS